jgi:multiple sugar transport system substrate-binding protein
MPKQDLLVALIAGAMYDRLYEALPEFTGATGIRVQIAFHAVHPKLNAHLASLNDMPYHLVSTHTKYAPSQLSFLGAVEEDLLEDFFPALVEMARIEGRVYGVPRNIDVKLLHYRHDTVAKPPKTWEELTATARALAGKDSYGFVFTGKDSGLFGMFFELAEMAGARLFPDDKIPRLNCEGGQWALQTIRDLYLSGAVPAAVVDWQYDEAHRCFRDGRAAMICDWPGYFGSYCAADSQVRGKFALARMPAGPLGVNRAYAGAHTFALTQRGVRDRGAVELLRFLTAPAQQLREAQAGSVPVRRSVMDQARGGDTGRLQLLEEVMASDMLIPPRIAYYPEIEEILWRTVRAAMTGGISVETALLTMETRIGECHRRHGGAPIQHAS